MTERLHGMVIQAHPDDRAQTAGVDVALAAAGIRLSVVTLTDGVARELPKFKGNKNRLQKVRAEEDKVSINYIGGVLLDTPKFPDSRLSKNIYSAAQLLSSIIAVDKPQFLITPHLYDPHDDHSATAEIALTVAGSEIPIYFMDTAIGRDKNGSKIAHTHSVQLTRNEIRKGKKAFRLHASQTEDLPPEEMRDVFDVLGMPKRIGGEHGVAYATALTLVDFSLGDPIAEIFGDERLIFSKDMQLA